MTMTQFPTPLFDALGPVAQVKLLKAVGKVNLQASGSPAQAEALLMSDEDTALLLNQTLGLCSKVQNIAIKRSEDPQWRTDILNSL